MLSKHKTILKRFIESLEFQGDTYYGVAFSAAFRLLSTARNQEPEQFKDSLDLILFLTDGKPFDSDQSIFRIINKGQEDMGHSVHVFVYGLGNEITKHKQLLMQLADQNNNIIQNDMAGGGLSWQGFPNVPVGRPGNVTFIGDNEGHQLRTEMGSYYTSFPMENQNNITISLPYVKGNIGLVITISVPVSSINDEFEGVVAVDLPLELTFYEALHYQHGQHNYAFVSGTNGIVLFHPLLHRPSYKSAVRIQKVKDLEPNLSYEAVYNITAGIEGTQKTKKKYLLTEDATLNPVTFHYMAVPGFEGTLTVVLVIFDDVSEHIPKTLSTMGPIPDLLSQLFSLNDVNQLTIEACTEKGNIVLPQNTTTFFFPKASAESTKRFDDQANRTRYSGDPFNDTSSFATFYDVSLRAAADAYLTNRIESLWITPGDFLWRYLGTENGMLKVFPGTVLSYPYYDPKQDEWYTKALEMKGRFVFLQAGEIVTIAKSVIMTSADQVSGVVAVDITSIHMSTLAANILESCGNTRGYECYLLDNTGFIFGRTGLTNGDRHKEHITEVLPSLSAKLIADGVMKSHWCFNLVNKDRQFSYQFDLPRGVEYQNSSSECEQYMISSLNSSNLYLILHKNGCQRSHLQKICSCSANCSDCTIYQNICQCPCTCRSNIEKTCHRDNATTYGLDPCSGSGRHWQSFKRKQPDWSSTKGNVTDCRQTCTSQHNATACVSVEGCNWCETGHYKHYPLCSRHCIIDRVKLKFISPCMDLSTLNEKNKTLIMEDFYKVILKRDSKKGNYTIRKPKLSRDEVIVSIETDDLTPVPESVVRDLQSSPVVLHHQSTNYSGDLLLVSRSRFNFTQLTLTLKMRGVNFTSELQHALTLRVHIRRLIFQWVMDNFPLEILNTLDNIWPDEDVISFSIIVPPNQSSASVLRVVQSVIEKFQSSPWTFDLLGQVVQVVNVSYTASFNDHCHILCGNIEDRHTCNTMGKCRWDLERKCTLNARLPERKIVSIYFPCMGLYDKVPATEQNKIITNIKERIRNVSRLSEEAIASVSFKQPDHAIGTKVIVELQGVFGDPDVIQSSSLLQDAVRWSNRFILTKELYRSDSTPTKYQHFTDIEITMTVKDVDFEEILVRRPLAARQEFQRALKTLVTTYFIPTVAESLSNVQIFKEAVEFSLFKPAGSSLDLRSYYETWLESVHEGKVVIDIFGCSYSINDTFFVGSFYQMCPRTCNEGLSKRECISIPGCHWIDNAQKCTDDVLLPESVSIAAILPCTSLKKLSDGAKHAMLTSFRRKVTDKLTNRFNVSLQSLRNFSIGQVYPDSLVFSVQGSTKSPPLSSTVREVNNWLHGRGLILKTRYGTNVTAIPASSVLQNSSLRIRLEYPELNFTRFIANRRNIRLSLQRQVEDLLPLNGFRVSNFLFSQNYTEFSIETQNGNDTMEKIQLRMKTFSEIGGFGVVVNGVKYLPGSFSSKQIFSNNCPVVCSTIPHEYDCNKLGACVWTKDVTGSSVCASDKLLPDRLNLLLYIPCNKTGTLSSSDKSETESNLLQDFTKNLNFNSSQVISDVQVVENGVIVELQSSVQKPQLDYYADQIRQMTDYRTGYSAGPHPNKLQFRSETDYTNVELKFKFAAIDFDVLRYRYTDDFIENAVYRRLNTILLGEIAQSARVTRISQDIVNVRLQKDKNSQIDMDSELSGIRTWVTDGNFVLEIPFIRPVKSTDVTITGTFKELCPEKYPEFSSSPDPFFTVTVETNVTIKPTNIVYTRYPLVLLFNESEVSRSEVQTAVDQSRWDVCVFKLQSLDTIQFSKKSCTFHKTNLGISTTTTTRKTPPVSDNGRASVDGVGPVSITCIVVSGVFLLALIVWFAQSLYEEISQKNCPEDSE